MLPHCLICLLMLILATGALSQDHFDSKVNDSVENYEKMKDNQTETFLPGTEHINNSLELLNSSSNDTSARFLELTGTNNKCRIRSRFRNKPPIVQPADSSHIWVFWSWNWFYTYYCSRCYNKCDPQRQMIVVVDGIEQKIQLASEKQNFAYVEANPCLRHDIKLKVFSDSEETDVMKYNDQSDSRLFSGFLHTTISERICLNKDNNSVKVLEPIEQLRLCLITRGDHKFETTEFTTNLIAGLINLTIVNPEINSDSDQPDQINITVPVAGIKRCKEGAFEERESESRIVLAAAIAIPLLAIITLIVVTLIAGFVFHRKRKNQKRSVMDTAVDENPMYGDEVYEHEYENGELRQNTIEVIDSSPYYRESTEEWEGSNITDRNDYYA